MHSPPVLHTHSPPALPNTGGLTPRRSPVRQGEKAGLSVAEARRELDLLEEEARSGKAVTVSLAWRVVEGGGEP
jgi:hypothetical protein